MVSMHSDSSLHRHELLRRGSSALGSFAQPPHQAAHRLFVPPRLRMIGDERAYQNI